MKLKIIFPTVVMSFGLMCGCATHTTSKDWSGLVGSNGDPMYYKATSKVAIKFLVVIPFIGDVSIDGLVEDLTEDIAEENGDYVRIVQADAENYWYGYPPFSWIITPVIHTVAAEYRPRLEDYEKDQKAISEKEATRYKYNPMTL